MIESFNANQSIEINLSNLAKGIYYLKGNLLFKGDIGAGYPD